MSSSVSELASRIEVAKYVIDPALQELFLRTQAERIRTDWDSHRQGDSAKPGPPGLFA